MENKMNATNLNQLFEEYKKVYDQINYPIEKELFIAKQRKLEELSEKIKYMQLKQKIKYSNNLY
ncbi:MAG: hypothetical protein A2268_00310 [Candidatus Raymondbacteria bacterium RifOxyA12_full_50_37]|uniref:Uncharacterized protein n=1 Tax=Candidatus Raymondbacteria bacterium RIFOXYD12_FULL_49_13 TaxID=1817890 RepID=A0A1F7F325_UNCRA|nr:MAG: hypothetical protein A2268_00310 [Candidatus Raymondbacteria bacterium RifOxyA12_full_50_37]OGJ92759.1 MAG: hypothetical protein A2248_04360 [Candidatus Raymondbacteria bacterium RIFOXYA2_FULL_49_16]OGK00962.1 MAG: hypothetical protein A2519_17020 [Candidatus Raymondbacteria bacterium RIFOXYD12_FULL_49_13]OGK04162.1 MAG: hypothetical protein A2350_02545 [Candidatus Raymondbacteria bacterium RifOxyB12_full_50_8]OGK04512.1 MAG: hypothetical protein A2487_16100 [Candidatus Raymondbacteria 